MALPLAQFVTVWAFLAVNIASPGPNVLNTIATAMGSGRVAGMGSAVAVGFGVALWCLGMTLGLAAVFAAVPLAQTLLTLVAAGLLAWFASRYLRAAWAGLRGAPGLPGAATGLGFAAGFRRSLLVNVLNPKALTSWLAILDVLSRGVRLGFRYRAALYRGQCHCDGVAHDLRGGLFHPCRRPPLPARGMGAFGLRRAVLRGLCLAPVRRNPDACRLTSANPT